MTARHIFHAVVAIVLLCLLAAIFSTYMRTMHITDSYTPMPAFTDQQLPETSAIP